MCQRESTGPNEGTPPRAGGADPLEVQESSDWWRDVYQDEKVKDHERPRYLLLLGDADVIKALRDL